MKRILSLALAASVSVGVLAGCGSSAVKDQVNPDKKDSITVMTINGQDISSEEYAAFLCYEKQMYESYFGMYLGANGGSMWENEEMVNQVQENAYNELCYGYAIRALADDLGITLDQADKEQIKEIKQQYYDGLATEATSTEEGVSGEEGYVQYINKMGFTSKMFDQMLENSVLLEDIEEYYYGANGIEKISDETIKNYYQDHYYHVKHILISNTDDEGNERADGGLSIAKTVIRELQAGADFDTLMETYNTDPGQPSDGYTFSDTDSFIQEFIDSSKALEIGKYTVEPVKSDYGYHIIYRLPLEDDTLNAATGSVNGGKIYDEIEESMKDMDSKMEKAVASLKIEKNEENLNKVTLFTFHKYAATQVEGVEQPETDTSADTKTTEDTEE